MRGGNTNGILSAGACGGREGRQGHVSPVRRLQRPIQRQCACRFPPPETNLGGILESKQNPSFQAVQTVLADRKHKKWCQNKYTNEMEITSRKVD